MSFQGNCRFTDCGILVDSLPSDKTQKVINGDKFEVLLDCLKHIKDNNNINYQLDNDADMTFFSFWYIAILIPIQFEKQ